MLSIYSLNLSLPLLPYIIQVRTFATLFIIGESVPGRNEMVKWILIFQSIIWN